LVIYSYDVILWTEIILILTGMIQPEDTEFNFPLCVILPSS